MKKKMIIATFIVVVGAFFTLGGQRLTISSIARVTTDFNIWPSDNRILYESGAGKLAEETAKYLDQAIETVESKQYGKFTKPVKIYAFTSTKSFSKFSGIPEVAKGASLGSEIYLSGKLLNILNEVDGMLTHELSHVQLVQTLGVIKFNSTLPRWFREGLAIYVANGGGATNATENETIENFLKGKHFIPEAKGALLNQRLNGTTKIDPKIFYRQSGNFVSFLSHAYPVKFKTLINGLQEGKQFEEIFTQSFKQTPNGILNNYIQTLRNTSTQPGLNQLTSRNHIINN